MMNDLELNKQLKDAFDSVKVPQDVRTRTLAAIETTRESEAEKAKKPHKLRAKKRATRFAYGIAACLVIALAGFFGYRSATEPTAYIDIDINPSIELAVNRFDYVVNAEALNDDAQTVLERVDVIGKPYSEAIETLTSEISLAGYDLSNSFMEFSILSDNAQQTANLETNTNAFMSTCGYSGQCRAVDASVHEAAHNCGMGTGKYLAAQELAELDPNITIEDCAHMSMRQIRDNINTCHQQSSGESLSTNSSDSSSAGTNTNTNAGNGMGYGNGNGNGNGNGHHGQNHGYHHHLE